MIIKRITMAALLSVLPLTVTVSAHAQAKPSKAETFDIKMFPVAKEGQARHVIRLPEQTGLGLNLVEVLVGKNLEVGCNNIRIWGTVQRKDLKGWGYSYYVASEISRQTSTLMACLDDTKETKFVSLAGQGIKTRYNSNLPIVVYAPKDLDVKYRIWSTNNEKIDSNIE